MIINITFKKVISSVLKLSRFVSIMILIIFGMMELSASAGETENKVADIEIYSNSVGGILKEAKAGIIVAQITAGNMYYYGNRGVGQDYEKAFMWYKKAAEAGSGEACNSIGNMYRNGIGVHKNNKMAVMYYQKGAVARHPGATGNLGRIYLHGTMGQKKDRIKAFELLYFSAKEGDRDSMNSLGYMYEKGYGTEKDYVKAAKFYRMAINKGNKSAKNGLKRVSKIMSRKKEKSL